ncbi:hypothetical protein E8E14_000996 [Neopestalotiopsis sp. 37M]|nr:hypothetical protein E8E14_000996 [Neopestalotiopsis sp. 37M]
MAAAEPTARRAKGLLSATVVLPMAIAEVWMASAMPDVSLALAHVQPQQMSRQTAHAAQMARSAKARVLVTAVPPAATAELATASAALVVKHPMASCKLESLHTNALILLLAAVTSVEDLNAFIHASPFVYRAFLLAKGPILAGISHNDLGPATRDALVLVHTERQPFSLGNSKLYYARLEETMADWRRRLLSDRQEWLRGITESKAEHLVQINRTVQYFVDLYACVRFAYFEQVLGSAVSSRSLSIAERHQLAQAFVRCQVILNPHCAPGLPPFDQGFLVTRVLGLFEPWEMEQISQADTFAYALCSALVNCEKTEEGVPRTQAWWTATRRALRDAAPVGGAVQEISAPRARYFRTTARSCCRCGARMSSPPRTTRSSWSEYCVGMMSPAVRWHTRRTSFSTTAIKSDPNT